MSLRGAQRRGNLTACVTELLRHAHNVVPYGATRNLDAKTWVVRHYPLTNSRSLTHRKDQPMYHTHEMVYIQDVKHYENGGSWTGSWKGVRYRCTPAKDDDGKITSVQVEVWLSNLCYELSQIVETRLFPLTDEGIEQAEHWLEEYHSE